jgi:folate-dependent phosphoribosylglycinamide formyltransferase PurN
VATSQGLALRREYDRVAAGLIQAFEVDLIALGGYMSIITLDRCVNVHPADLSIFNGHGNRRFVGDDAVLDAIAAGQRELRSSTIWADQGVDTGPLLMLSPPLAVDLPAPLEELKADPKRLRQVADEHQERLKLAGDWIVFPATMEAIARGRLALDQEGNVFVDGEPAPRGVSL